MGSYTSCKESTARVSRFHLIRGRAEKGANVMIDSLEHCKTPHFQVDLVSSGSECTLVLRGELRVASLSALEVKIDQLGCMPCQQVTLDMRRLTHLDQVGANVILGLYHYVVARGGALCVTGAGAEPASTLQSVAGSMIPIEVRATAPLLA
jgi:anti-anti-sigma regulatory factor